MKLRWIGILASIGSAAACTEVELGSALLEVEEWKGAPLEGFVVEYEPGGQLSKSGAERALYAELGSRRRTVVLQIGVPTPTKRVEVQWRERARTDGDGPWVEGSAVAGWLSRGPSYRYRFALQVRTAQGTRTVSGTFSLANRDLDGRPAATWQWPGTGAGAPWPPPGPAEPLPVPRTDPIDRPPDRPADRPADRRGRAWTAVAAVLSEGTGCSDRASGCDGGTGGSGCAGDEADLSGCADSCDGDLAVTAAPLAGLRRSWARFGPCVVAGLWNRWQRRRRAGR